MDTDMENESMIGADIAVACFERNISKLVYEIAEKYHWEFIGHSRCTVI